ncbi:unnamed protein product [Trichobilharzia szidati]|nr:unnamed protein product [Trichobilharzia szidati]
MLGRRFFSWEEFENSLGEFQQLSCTHYVHIQSKTTGDDRYKYAYVYFKCTFGVNRGKAGLKLRNKSSKCCNCLSAFRVILRDSEYVITSHKMVHNHSCTSVYMQNDPWSRRLSAEEKENVEPLLHQSHSTSAIVPRNQCDLYVTNRRLINAGLTRICDKYGRTFAAEFAGEVVAQINNVLDV